MRGGKPGMRGGRFDKQRSVAPISTVSYAECKMCANPNFMILASKNGYSLVN